MISRKTPARGPLLDPPTNIMFSYQSPRRAQLREPQSDQPKNSRVRSCSYQQLRQVPNTPCPLRSVRRDKSQLTMMIEMKMMEAMLTGVPVTVGGHLVSKKLAGPISLVVDLSWRYFPPPFFSGNFFRKKNFLNIVNIQSFSYHILKLYVICECIR